MDVYGRLTKCDRFQIESDFKQRYVYVPEHKIDWPAVVGAAVFVFVLTWVCFELFGAQKNAPSASAFATTDVMRVLTREGITVVLPAGTPVYLPTSRTDGQTYIESAWTAVVGGHAHEFKAGARLCVADDPEPPPAPKAKPRFVEQPQYQYGKH